MIWAFALLWAPAGVENAWERSFSKSQPLAESWGFSTSLPKHECHYDLPGNKPLFYQTIYPISVHFNTAHQLPPGNFVLSRDSNDLRKLFGSYVLFFSSTIYTKLDAITLLLPGIILLKVFFCFLVKKIYFKQTIVNWRLFVCLFWSNTSINLSLVTKCLIPTQLKLFIKEKLIIFK